MGASSSGAQPQALIFSEYTEPSTGNTKGIEIYNGTGGTADLGAYVLRVLVNGGSSQNDLTLAGALGAGGTHVVCNSNSAAALLGRCNTPWGSLTFNGDDTLVLLLNGVQVDAFGDGTDPGTAWGTTVKSMNGTLQRKCSVTRGMAALTPPFDPATEWDLVPDEALTGFGSWHCGGPGGSSSSAASSGTSAVISSSQATASSAAGSSSASSFSSPSSSSVGTSNSSAGGSSVVLLGITVAPPQAFETTDEDGRTVVFGLRLPVAPTADVTVPVSFSLDGELVALVNPVVLTPSTGTANQPVTLQGLPDDVVDGNRAVTVVVGPAVSADARFNGATGTSFVVTNQDTDIADVVAALETRPLVENGGPVQVALRLSARPTQNVTLTFSGSDTTAATLTETSVMFEPDQWNVPHLITVLPTDDASVDGPQPFVVTFDATTSGDPAWSGLVPTALSLNVQDDEFRQLSMGGGWPSMNADGTRVAFVGEDLMVLDVVTGETTSVTEGCTTPGIWGSPVHAAQSDEVVFLSSCTYLLNGVAGPAGPLQLFIWNPDDGLTHVAGTGEVEPSGGVSISADGRVVAFTALASLVPADTDADNDLYLYDRLSSGFTRVTTTATPPGVQPYSYYHLSEGSFGGNDRFIAFRTESNNIVVGDQNNSADAFLFDRSTSNVTRINTNMQGAVGGSLKSLSLSLDGNHAVMLGASPLKGMQRLRFT